jgi:hypothetical protein
VCRLEHSLNTSVLPQYEPEQTSIMSAARSTATPPILLSIFDAKEYKRKTEQGLREHPVAAEFDRCGSAGAVPAVFQKQTDVLNVAVKRD